MENKKNTEYLLCARHWHILSHLILKTCQCDGIRLHSQRSKKVQEDMQIAQVLTAANSRAEIWGQIPYGFHPAMLPYENTVLVPSGKETGTRDHQPCANYFETYPCVPHLLQFQLHQHADNLPNSMGPLQRTIKSPPLQLHKSGAWGWKHYEIPSIWHPPSQGNLISNPEGWLWKETGRNPKEFSWLCTHGLHDGHSAAHVVAKQYKH